MDPMKIFVLLLILVVEAMLAVHVDNDNSDGAPRAPGPDSEQQTRIRVVSFNSTNKTNTSKDLTEELRWLPLSDMRVGKNRNNSLSEEG